MSNSEYAIDVRDLTYSFPHSKNAAIEHIDLAIPWHKKTLLVGNNGAGKSTVLKLLSGKHLCLGAHIRIDGRDPFAPNNDQEDVVLTTYLGTEWATMSIINRDIGVLELLESVGLRFYRDRASQLIQILEVDVNWRMFNLSDGQKRRVQLCMGLLKPFKVLLLDEVTVDLDVVARDKLFQFLDHETKTRQCCVLYATHIFDGLSNWADDIVHISDGRIRAKLNASDDIRYDKNTEGVLEPDNMSSSSSFVLGYIKSLYPLALHWLSRDFHEHPSETTNLQ